MNFFLLESTVLQELNELVLRCMVVVNRVQTSATLIGFGQLEVHLPINKSTLVVQCVGCRAYDAANHKDVFESLAPPEIAFRCVIQNMTFCETIEGALGPAHDFLGILYALSIFDIQFISETLAYGELPIFRITVDKLSYQFQTSFLPISFWFQNHVPYLHTWHVRAFS